MVNSNSDQDNYASIIEEEMTLKEFIQLLKRYFNFLKSYSKLVILITLIAAILGFNFAFFSKPIYTAKLTFALEEDKAPGGAIGGALGIASSLGVDLGGGVSGAFSGTSLLELIKSRNLVKKALYSSINNREKEQSIISYYLETTNKYDGFKKSLGPNSSQMLSTLNKSNSDIIIRIQDSLMMLLYHDMVGKNGVLSVYQKDKKIGIMTIEVRYHDALFAKVFSEAIAKVVSDFYIETKSKKARENYEILKSQTDSIRNELNVSLSGLANANDDTYNLNPALNSKRLPSTKRQIDVQSNTAILSQLITNLEMAKVTLRRETPLIQIIDKPEFPLEREKPSIMLYTVMFGLVAFLLTTLILILSLFIKERLE